MANEFPKGFDRFHPMPSTYKCPECSQDHQFSPDEIDFVNYEQQSFPCQQCNHQISAWKSAILTMSESWPGQIFTLLGANLIIGSFEMPIDTPYHFDFGELDVPPDGRVIDLSITPNTESGAFPVAGYHLNTPFRHRGDVSHEFLLYPTVLRDPAPKGPYMVAFSAAWIPDSEFDDSWRSITEAVSYLDNGKLNNAIVPACTSVESRLNYVLTKFYFSIDKCRKG